MPRPLNAGQKDQQVTLQRRAAGVGALGQESGAWQTVVTVWAHVEPLRGREFFAAGQVQSEVSVRMRINFRTDVQAGWRVLWRGVPHDIVAPPIDPDGARVNLELMCATGSRDGR